MISIAVFPCFFTDGARVIGELAYAFSKPVYTDLMLLQKIEENSGMTVNRLENILFSRTPQTGRCNYAKEEIIRLLEQYLDTLRSEAEDWIYYGFFTSLLHSECSLTHKILIISDEKCRIKRAIRQEGISETIAREIIRKHQEKASCWTQYLFNQEPYRAELYDTVIRYECQDLFDVVAYVLMLCEWQEKISEMYNPL